MNDATLAKYQRAAEADAAALNAASDGDGGDRSCAFDGVRVGGGQGDYRCAGAAVADRHRCCDAMLQATHRKAMVPAGRDMPTMQVERLQHPAAAGDVRRRRRQTVKTEGEKT